MHLQVKLLSTVYRCLELLVTKKVKEMAAARKQHYSGIDILVLSYSNSRPFEPLKFVNGGARKVWESLRTCKTAVWSSQKKKSETHFLNSEKSKHVGMPEKYFRQAIFPKDPTFLFF